MAINLGLVGKKSDPLTFDYDTNTCILYGLGIGAQPDEIDFLFEHASEFKVHPTFAVVPSFNAMLNVVGDLGANPMMILHGEQKIVLHRSIPPQAKLTTVSEVTGIYDKGKGALAIVEAKTYLPGNEPLFDNVFSIFCRGEGGFGGDRGPEALKADPPADRKPDFRVEFPTAPTQALLYRLSGDRNPLHANAQFAQMGGFSRPILHGLCTYGFAGRAILKSICGGDPAKFKSFAARFSSVIYPGDTIVTEGWKTEKGRYIIRASNQDGTVVLSNSIAEVAE